MLTNICTKAEVLEHFDLWLWERYDWLGFEQLNKILIQAEVLLNEDLDYYADAGHRVLYNVITGG